MQGELTRLFEREGPARLITSADHGDRCAPIHFNAAAGERAVALGENLDLGPGKPGETALRHGPFVRRTIGVSRGGDADAHAFELGNGD